MSISIITQPPPKEKYKKRAALAGAVIRPIKAADPEKPITLILLGEVYRYILSGDWGGSHDQPES